MANKYFHFTLGPVQGFVAQARRTRDFWAGSFLLSWLSGVAMAEVVRQCGPEAISFPTPPAGYLDWITGHNTGGEPPRQGAIPNRFKATVNEEFQPALVEQAVREAWLSLAEHVWNADSLTGVATRDIWDRQHRGFWEISWALTSEANASNLLDRRKNWRNAYHQPEPGVKCMVMDGWQELSGVPTPNRSDSGEFWRSLRQSPGSMQTDLLEDEHLCALAYVKRRFVRHFADFSTTLSSGLFLKGWPLEFGMPSVSYMAAVHWLRALVETTDEADLGKIAEAAARVNPSRDEWDTRIRCLVDTWQGKGYVSTRRKLLSLDGNLFFSHVQDNPKAYGYDPAAMASLKNCIRDVVRQNDLNEPLSPFYAILLMDGDSLGKHMADPAKQTLIAQSLEKFTSGVKALVEQRNGYLVYAGGDDVLAILPLEDALQCALDVRTHYLNCFAGKDIATSISAAIEFAHVKMPLGKVLSDAHDLLDNIAKDATGRDALAVRVWKTGGLALQWAQPWEKAIEQQRLIIDSLAEAFREDMPSGDAGQVSSKFFYRIRERFDFLNAGIERTGKAEAVLSHNHCIKLMAVDYVNSGDNRKKLDMDKAEAEIKPLLSQCTPHHRKFETVATFVAAEHLEVDGALLVRFLAQKGVEQ